MGSNIYYSVMLFLFISVNILLSQPSKENYPGKIHPFFREEIENLKNGIVSTFNKIKTKSVGKNEKGERIFRVMIKIDNELDILENGYNINSVILGFATARVTLMEMEELSQKDYISFIYPGETLYPTNDIGGALVGADLVKNGYINDTSYDGTDVIVLIIDTGIDWSHEDFQNSGSPSTSRILYIWDQTDDKDINTPEDRDGTTFAGLNYGVEYTQAQINDEIDGSPAGVVLESDINGHGTHVAGSAAGNGSSLSTNKFEGIASNADIVVVKAGNGSFDTVDLIDALQYAEKISDTEGKPVVVNMSLGGHANAHDGTRDLDIAIDNFTSSGNGRIAVISAGNEGNSAIHITGTTAIGFSSNIVINVSSYTPNPKTNNDYFSLDLWWNNNGNVTAEVYSPNGYSHSQVSNSQGTGTTNDGAIYIFNYVDASHTNGDRRNNFQIYDGQPGKPVAQGDWTFTVTNSSGSAMTYHAWLYASTMNTTLIGGDTDYTVGSPGVAASAITVGAYVSRWMWSNSTGSGYSYSETPDRTDNIASFSSIGPRRDEVQKPDITAPGQGIFSSKSSDYTPSLSRIAPGNKHYMTQGTSMSSPICAGAVALLLDYDASLTAAQVKAYIIGNADTDSFTSTVPNYTWGYGKLNIFRAMVYAINSISVTNELVETQDWTTGYNHFASGDDWLSEKITPTISGKVTDVLFYPGTGSISGNIPIEIWTDDNGSPDAITGSAVNFDQNSLLSVSWNKLYFTSAGANVTAGTPYHIVMKIPSGSSYTYIADNSGTATGSKISSNSGTTWSLSIYDFGIRAVVTPLESAVPVELVSFSAKAANNSVLLNWQTATEVNNYGFNVERASTSLSTNESSSSRAETRGWEKIGFVEGHGNSNSPKDYTFYDSEPSNGIVKYRLKQIDTDGTFEYSEEVEIEVTLTIENNLVGNYPNPFNPTTTIRFDLAKEGDVSITIYNVLGEVVQTLINQKMITGKHKVEFDASNLSSGIYFYELNFTPNGGQAGNFVDVKKMVVTK